MTGAVSLTAALEREMPVQFAHLESTKGRSSQAWGGDLSDEEIEKNTKCRFALYQTALARLRSGSWQAEGFRPGSTVPEQISQAWWQRDVMLNVERGEALWNDVSYVGIMVHIVRPIEATPSPPDVAAPPQPQSHPQSMLQAVKERMTMIALQRRSAGGLPTKPELIEATRAWFKEREVQVSGRQALLAYTKLPDDLRIPVGVHRKKS